ncbi:pyridoxine/pyridoxamine 5'-phosphate oxidase [Agaricicola taiwanensis]|uniref:Pyridoxine/pyridoxamine 5'-phosphate oxidase n=2 Tax=Agaricicola taiwanensis TaxID=591372 RepID=A0A8J2VP30_9RHOB|nr:pyridoxine/pyridoxamine 5'-phosphate oxidase [Agaricicola taiwanensis]
MGEAAASEPSDPNAMTLATVDQDGLPNARIVLLKGFDTHGFVFYTNTESAKGRELLAVPKAALVFHWKSLTRQVRIRGTVSMVDDAEADAYYASRPRGSRISAWASQQSRPLESRERFIADIAAVEARYGEGEITRPSHWTGFRLAPLFIEFWHDRPFRRHDRIVFQRDPSGGWTTTRLYP